MEFKNVTREELDLALAETNKEFNNNVIWNNPYHTLRVIDSHKKGGRLSHAYKMNNDNGNSNKGVRKYNCSACWHVHGTFFDKLLGINPKAIIVTAMSKIYKDSYDNTIGNWIDKNIGSMMYPLYYSEACSCE